MEKVMDVHLIKGPIFIVKKYLRRCLASISSGWTGLGAPIIIVVVFTIIITRDFYTYNLIK